MKKLTIYYDGLCQLCSREIESYQKMKAGQQFAYQDITDEGFDPKKDGLDPLAIHKKMHIRLASGQVLTGVEAFLEIWKHLPWYRTLVPVVGNPLVKPFAKICYSIFARLRVYLPKRKKSCQSSPYCDL